MSVACFNGERTALGHCITSVDREVEDRAFALMRIADLLPQPSARDDFQPHRPPILDTPREAAFYEAAVLAATLCDASIAVVTLIGDRRQFFKAEVGFGVGETPFESSFCAKAILEMGFLLVADAAQDTRFDCNPLVVSEPRLRFYAGAHSKTGEGLPVERCACWITNPGSQPNCRPKLSRTPGSTASLLVVFPTAAPEPPCAGSAQS